MVGVMETDKQTLYLELIQFLTESGSNMATLRKLMNDYREKSEQNQYSFCGQYHASTHVSTSQAQKRPFETAFSDSDPHQQVPFLKKFHVNFF